MFEIIASLGKTGLRLFGAESLTLKCGMFRHCLLCIGAYKHLDFYVPAVKIFFQKIKLFSNISLFQRTVFQKKQLFVIFFFQKHIFF